VPTVPEALSKELDDLETRFGEDRPAIELNLARFFLVILLGVDWGDKRVNLRPDPDPWMLNGNRAWLAKHPVPSDVRRIVWHYRTVRLANALFTLVTEDRTTGYERLRLRFMTRPDMRATFTEAEIASLLVTNRCEVEIVGESGIRGNDFDLLAKVEQTPVSVEVTVISGANLSAKTVDTLPSTRCDRPLPLSPTARCMPAIRGSGVTARQPARLIPSTSEPGTRTSPRSGTSAMVGAG
jgi:hypothetical protein